MTDEELTAFLRDLPFLRAAKAADRIEELTAERELFEDSWAYAADKLARAVKTIGDLLRYVPASVVECRGDKCREPWCASCDGWDAAELGLAIAQADGMTARALLAEIEGEKS
jgi:hypothetical protein